MDIAVKEDIMIIEVEDMIMVIMKGTEKETKGDKKNT